MEKRLYNIWACMKQRCNNPKHTATEWYYKRGIRVCKEWNDSFSKFEKWALKAGYSDGLSIDRIDPDGNYCPENCRWIPLDENKRRARRTTGSKRVGLKKGKFMVVKHPIYARYIDPGIVIRTGLTKQEAGIFILKMIGDRHWERRQYSVLVTDGNKEGDSVYLKNCRYYLNSKKFA